MTDLCVAPPPDGPSVQLAPEFLRHPARLRRETGRVKLIGDHQ